MGNYVLPLKNTSSLKNDAILMTSKWRNLQHRFAYNNQQFYLKKIFIELWKQEMWCRCYKSVSN